MPKIQVLYDNISAQKGVKPAWGFSALVEYQDRVVLFDTGGKADILLANMKAMRVSPREVTDIFISHNHWDHTGGLFGFLSKNHEVKVYVPASCSKAYQKEITATGAKCRAIKEVSKLYDGIFSGGELGSSIKEQALILDTPQGVIVMTGCAHPGILKIVKEAKKSLAKPVFAVLGGFHLAAKSDAEVNKIIAEFKRLGVASAGPCHCTGEKAIKQFKKAYGVNFVSIGAGSVINL